MSGLLVLVAQMAYLTVSRRASSAPVNSIQSASTDSTRIMLVHTNSVSAVAFFNDNRRIVTASEDKTLRIWDVEKRTFVGGPFKGHCDYVVSVAVSPDDRRIVSGGGDRTIIIWDVESEQMVFPLKLKDSVRSVCFSPDGKRLVIVLLNYTVVIWDVETGAILSALRCRGVVKCVSFSPDGLKVARGSLHTVQVWRTDNNELLLKIDAHEDYVRSVLWTPDGQQLVSASDDKTIKFWDSSNGTQIGQPCTGHTDYINSLTISSDGSFIATASDDNTVRLWSTKSHKQIGQPLEHTIHIRYIAIAPNGELLVSGDDYGNVQFWSIGNALSATFGLDSSYDSFFAHRSKGRFDRNLYVEALSDADKVIELNPSSHIGYELKHAALHGAQRYDDAFDVFKVMLSNLDNAHDAQMQKLRQKYISASEALEAAVRRAIYAQLENAPLRLINTSTGRLCNRDAQIDVFIESTEYKELFSPSVMHGPLQTEPIKEVVAKYFSWVMLSHRWERKEPLLHDIQDNDIYDLDPVGTVVKLQKFCKVARDAGHRWAWSDTCCIDQNNNVEVQQSVNSMFVWYHYSALTIVYLTDVPPSSESGALANSIWNTRGWTVQEFLAPKIVLFYQADWTLYLDNHSRNHKESVAITQELERSTGINARALVAFRPGTRDAREKLQWASHRETTREEDIAYSLFGIFDVNLPVIYGEKRQKALGRLLQEIIAHSGDITALDWVGQPSNFNSCLPADISSYKAPSCTPLSLSEDEMRNSVSMLRNIVTVESASKLYTTLENLGVPRFANCRLQLPCIAFPLTEVRQRPGQYADQYFIYDVKADGLHDLSITTEDELVQFWAGRPIRRKVLLIRPWTHYLLEPSDFAELPGIDDESSVEDYWSAPGSPLHDSPPGSPGEQGPVNSESSERAFRLIVHLGQPFSAFLLTQQRGGEYMRIASDNNIIVQVTDATCVENFMDVRTLEIL